MAYDTAARRIRGVMAICNFTEDGTPTTVAGGDVPVFPEPAASVAGASCASLCSSVCLFDVVTYHPGKEAAQLVWVEPFVFDFLYAQNTSRMAAKHAVLVGQDSIPVPCQLFSLLWVGVSAAERRISTPSMLGT